jgi:hypothetical protein
MVLQSKPGQTMLLAAVCAILGLVLLAGFRGYTQVNSNEFAGFMLGMLLFCLGVAGLAVRESRRIELDNGRRQFEQAIGRSSLSP